MRHITRFEVVNLIAMRQALDHHNETCDVAATAFLLNPVDFGLLRWEQLWGVPVLPNDEVRVKHFRLECEGRSVEEGELPADAAMRA